MKKSTLKFVKAEIKQHYTRVESSNGKDAGTIAVALFGNQEFCDVIFDIFGAGYYRETKLELPTDTKGRVLHTLTEMIEAIDKRIADLE